MGGDSDGFRWREEMGINLAEMHYMQYEILKNI